ncbi:MAG: ATP-binding cassette domain-containing protein [Phycisphaerae bacterium]|nr:ATP-binding cassette domain-containing protein [Phycisphaerae bacterium]
MGLTGEVADAGAFWALEDLTFQVAQGEALAIIGPNGAGKSTALKLLSGIMPPTRGRIVVRGRISALIEVGAGFHPDLTGRENIHLNASVLGIGRSQSRRIFNDIVEFAGIAPFLDTPLKRYSSGMYARLGFAVAAHVEPDVLLVDEVLSVGDRVFRAKCMDRMRQFRQQGVAVILVSHDLNAVTGFCDRAVVLDRGRTTFTGGATEAVSHYHRACFPASTGRNGSDSVTRREMTISMFNSRGEPSLSFVSCERIAVVCDEVAATAGSVAVFQLLRLRDGFVVFEENCEPARWGFGRGGEDAGVGCAQLRFDLALNVPPGEYIVRIGVRGRDNTPSALSVVLGECRFMVTGPVRSGGVIEVSPRFEATAH